MSLPHPEVEEPERQHSTEMGRGPSRGGETGPPRNRGETERRDPKRRLRDGGGRTESLEGEQRGPGREDTETRGERHSWRDPGTAGGGEVRLGDSDTGTEMQRHRRA